MGTSLDQGQYEQFAQHCYIADTANSHATCQSSPTQGPHLLRAVRAPCTAAGRTAAAAAAGGAGAVVAAGEASSADAGCRSAAAWLQAAPTAGHTACKAGLVWTYNT